MPVHPLPLPTLPNFTEFIYFNNLILPHEILQIDQYWKDEQSEQAEVSGKDESYVEELRKSSVIEIEPDGNNKWIFERKSMLAMQANDQHYNFNISGFFEPMQLAEYKVGDFFDWHLDFGVGPTSNRKLSISVQLSDPDDYEGGDLQFQINHKSIGAPREKSTVIVFPSFIMHRVTPITRGKRRSIVAWVSGTPYR